MLEYDDDESKWKNAGWKEGSNGNYWYREWKLSDVSKDSGVDLDLDEERTGRYRAIVEKVESNRITIVTQSVVSGGRKVVTGIEISRIIETEFSKPNPACMCLIARDTLNFNRRPTFDSYDSRKFPYVYSFGVNSDSNMTVGSVSLDKARTLDLGNSYIYGDLATGAADDGTDPTGGSTVSGDVVWDFEMDFPPVEVPDTTGWNDKAP